MLFGKNVLQNFMPFKPRHLSNTNLRNRQKGSLYWKRQSTYPPIDEKINKVLIDKIKQYEKNYLY